MTRPEVAAWLAAYVAACVEDDAAAVPSLFTDDAVYAGHPFRPPLEGAAAIAASWPEEPGGLEGFEASAEVVAVDAGTDVAVARWHAVYRRPAVREFDSLLLLRFAGDGRCRAFGEWFVEAGTGMDGRPDDRIEEAP